MKKVLIVDDEKLVRQGIIATFPWKEHGFAVAHDASSGEKALEVLAREEVDLLVTDLAMNGMSGLELIRQARRMREDLPVVILTCHDNFRYVQDAIRLGVLDYIVKTEIEDEAVDQTLARIAAKLNESAEPLQVETLGTDTAQDGLLLCGPTRSSVPAPMLERHGRAGWAALLAEVDAAAWFARVTPQEAGRWTSDLAEEPDADWRVIHFAGVGEEDQSSVIEKLRRYRRRILFYEPPRAVAELDWTELPDDLPPGEERIAALREEWTGSGWIYSGERFERLLLLTTEARPAAGELHSIFYHAVLEWERLVETGSLETFLGEADDWLYWKDWEAWLRTFRASIVRKVEFNSTRQHADAVFRAIELVRARLDADVSEAEIAASVHMSRGHFSKSFKRVTGKSYGDYVRILKLEHAKKLLLRTDEPITRVAELCGFQDYRYFSRLFRDYTGKLPTDYRKTGDAMKV